MPNLWRHVASPVHRSIPSNALNCLLHLPICSLPALLYHVHMHSSLDRRAGRAGSLYRGADAGWAVAPALGALEGKHARQADSDDHVRSPDRLKCLDHVLVFVAQPEGRREVKRGELIEREVLESGEHVGRVDRRGRDQENCERPGTGLAYKHGRDDRWSRRVRGLLPRDPPSKSIPEGPLRQILMKHPSAAAIPTPNSVEAYCHGNHQHAGATGSAKPASLVISPGQGSPGRCARRPRLGRRLNSCGG